ncbi:MAG TPA: hypothetical protein VE085_13945 [Burkholderiales bacterium]|nr:hypothetical protein [Burkholderiales bacterium]
MARQGRRHGADEGADRRRGCKKLGSVIEGTQKKHAFRDGEFVDSYRMARGR